MTQITDVKPKYKPSVAHSIVAPIGTTAQLADPDGLFNDLQESIKRYGSVVIANGITADAGHALVMATGSAYNAKWTGLNIADDVAVTASSATTRPGSDSKPKLKKRRLGSLDFPVVTETQIKDGNHAINSFLYGGKKFGAGVIVALDSGRFQMVLAGGSLATDKWYGVDGTALFTPSAETVVAAPFDKKPHVVKSVVAAVPFASCTLAELVVAANNINTGDGASSGKRVGSLMVAYDDSAPIPQLFMAAGDSPTDKWVQLLGNDTTGAVTPA